MRGQPARFRNRGGGRGTAPPQQPPLPYLNPIYLPNQNFYIQNPSFPIHVPNFPIQTSNVPIQNPNFTSRGQSASNRRRPPNEALEKIDKAVVKARRELIAAGENVSALKVSQSVLVTLQADSWESLGFQMQQVPSLYSLMLTEGKINAFIHCFVAVWRITTLSDLEVAICKNEGVQLFEELELGPLIRHPLVNHYFCVSSCSTEVFRISCEEILSCLVEFMDTSKTKEVKADELLDFIAKKRSVTSKEKLHVRIQGLGMHVAHIRQARQLENATIKKCLAGVGKKRKKRPLFTSQKKQLDENFSAITQRIKSFSKEHGNHVRFISSSSGDDGSDDIESEDNEDENCSGNYSKNSSQTLNSSDRVSSCPYPSATEEMARLGILGEKEESPLLTTGSMAKCKGSVGPSKKKRKSEEINSNSSATRKLSKRDLIGQDSVFDNSDKMSSHLDDVVDVSLTYDSMMTFITTWKEACRKNDVSEVFHRMIRFYKAPCKPKRRKKLIAKFFSSYPYIGLLNVAVKSIKDGMWDSMYDSFQNFEKQEEPITGSEAYTHNLSIEVEPAENDGQLVTKHKCNQRHDVSIEDILKKVSEFLKDHHDIPSDLSSPLGKNVILLKRLFKCEVWLDEQFVVEKFECLGYGDFLTFLERHFSLLPPSIQKCCATVEACEKLSLEARMPKQVLDVLVAQVTYSLSENENLSVENVEKLLTRQFPSICLKLVEGVSVKDLLDVTKAKKSNLISERLLFSAALSVPRNVNSSSDTHVSSKDAKEVLLRAPMLADLDSWSHWDLLFAPSLGPLMGWLLNELNTEELLCLVTRSGNIIRMDHTATVDSFLEAFIQGSSFQTAVRLLSLFALYGGERNVPLSLLKCHTEKALEVIMKNSVKNRVENCQNYLTNELNKEKNQVNEGIPSASKFILDCLTYLPVEFRCFAADLLLSGFRSIVKDAPSAILNQCRQAEHRLMLHDLGLSLGIMEWISDYDNNSSFSEFNESSELDRGNSTLNSYASAGGKVVVSALDNAQNEESEGFHSMAKRMDIRGDNSGCDHQMQHLSKTASEREPAMFIESIRREEFGLDPNISDEESCILKKQHARLGRALHCLSQELYSQDSHFLLELVQNADDNAYPCDVEPTLTFILQEGGVIVLNNEQGFSAENIKALCDVGNSTKKEPSAGYIGKKGIGFKSVFRVTDAPEIHSNGFHIKFDISEGQIGFVLPTVVPPCNVDLFSKLVSVNADTVDKEYWNTCIVLPFRSKKAEAFAMDNIINMFSDLHPSLLLFLHRLECIKFKNLLNDSDSLVVMRKEVVGDGIVNVSLGKKKMTWFVKSHKLHADHIRHDVRTTEISVALMLEELANGNYIPKLDYQPVFAFLPLRNYGLKFIIQADFVLPSSREEVDGDSPWNQWLLAEFPNLFVNAERSLCNLPCFKENPGKGVSAFMSFVPLVGEVHGFFSSLPRIIISKLRISNCLLLEGDTNEWVPPCKVMRNWTEQIRSLLPDSLLREHLGLGYLNKDTVLTDSLARALGIEECGPRVLVQIMTSLCRTGSLKSMGHQWLSSWLNLLYLMSFQNISGESSLDGATQPDVISALRQLPFIPLLEGRYASIDEGAIWLNTDALSNGVDADGLEAYGKLYPKLRIVHPDLFYDSLVENLTQMLYKVGVQQLSAHEVLKVHILPAISDEKCMTGNKDLMTEYLSFIMFHLESTCSECIMDREHILSELRNKAFILTNHGYKRLVEVPIHFSKDFGNPVDMSKLVDGISMKWFEVDISYIKHPVIKSSSGGMSKWRKFLQELGVNDFVQIVQVEKSIADISHSTLKTMMFDDKIPPSGSIVKDWESQELVHLLSHISSNGNREKCKYLLEVLDTLWDDYFSDKLTGFCGINGENKPFKSSLISIFQSTPWLASTLDDELHYAKDLFRDCDAVRSVLGDTAPYAIPKVHSTKLLNDIGLKNTVTLDDAFSVLQVWRRSKAPFRASISQMTKFYTYIWNEMTTSKQKIVEILHLGAFIFVPFSFGSTLEVVPGLFLSPEEVYWHDSTGSMEQMKSIHPQYDRDITHRPFSKMLSSVYPGLHYFFVNELGVTENPPLLGYLESLRQLSGGLLPSQAAKTVFEVFRKWTDGLESGLLSCDDIEYLKKRLEEKEMIIFPTVLDKWVSLHQSFGLLCWSNDEKLRKEFKNLNNVDFLHLGELNSEEKQILHNKVSVLFKRLGIPSLSEVVIREAIYYGPTDGSFKTSLVSWALPYAQRYIYYVHPDKYSQLKLSGFKNLNCLRIVVVEKLFYRNVIKRYNIESIKRFECSCLLQDSILYATRESDTHSLFMELSQFLVPGIPELHLANFLHMITTMVESGSTEEQMEFFIINSQKLPKLPNEEPEWSLQSIPSSAAEVEEILTTSSGLLLDEPNPPKSTKKLVNDSNWPPVNWKTAPGFDYALKTGGFGSPQANRKDVEEVAIQADAVGSIEINADWIIEENLASMIPSLLEDNEGLNGQSDSGTNVGPSDMNHSLKGQSDHGTSMISDTNVGISPVSSYGGPDASSSNLSKRDQLYLGAATPQQTKTGRLGEVVAFKYFSMRVGEKYVKWVNEVKESGLPYDIVVKGKDESKEYIEVKATTSARKDWFVISVREWQFAVEKGESFSIARVVLSGEKSAQIMTYKNPVRLCQLGQLQLAILTPK